MSVHPIRLSLPDAVFVGRARYLMDLLAEAQDEMVVALSSSPWDVQAAKAAARRLASVGWLFREAADKHRDTAESAVREPEAVRSGSGSVPYRHVSDDGLWCDGLLRPYAPITHVGFAPPTALAFPIPRSKCLVCGDVLFTPDQHQTGPGASLLEDRGTGARKDTP